VILNAANSTVGQVIIQLCHLLQLRCVAVVCECEQPLEGFTLLADRLKALGASHVIQDSGSLKVLKSCNVSCLDFFVLQSGSAAHMHSKLLTNHSFCSKHSML